MHHISAHARRLADEAGTTAAEYAIIASLIALVIIAAVTVIGLRVDGMFQGVQGAFG